MTDETKWESRGISMAPATWKRVADRAQKEGRKSLSEMVERLVTLQLDRMESEEAKA